MQLVHEQNPVESELIDDLDIANYKALCVPAVASAALGTVSLLTFVSGFFAFVPALGVLLGWMALQSLRARSHELTGQPFAWIGFSLSLFCLVGGLGYRAYAYATEVSPGYERVSYALLQPTDAQQRVLRLPQTAEDINGKLVHIRGFMYPDARQHDLTKFVLCRDKGDCCFGGNPKATDRVMVRISDPQKAVDFTDREIAVEGRFRIAEHISPGGMGGAVYYHIDADQVKH